MVGCGGLVECGFGGDDGVCGYGCGSETREEMAQERETRCYLVTGGERFITLAFRGRFL